MIYDVIKNTISDVISNIVKAGEGVSVETLATTLAHWDATVSSSLTVVSDQVSQWDDISGNGYNLSQAATSFRPSIEGGGVRFQLDALEGSSSNLANKDFSIFVVCKIDSAADNDFLFGTTGSSNDNSLIFGSRNHPVYEAGTVNQKLQFAATEQQKTLLSFTTKASGSQVFELNSDVGTGGASQQIAANNNFIVGAAFSASSSNAIADATIYEILIIEETDAPTITTVRNNLILKHSISLSAPINVEPVAVSDTGTTNESTILSVNAASGVLSNDTDADADALTVTSVSNNSTSVSAGVSIAGTGGGLFNIAADGSYTFNPNSEFDALALGESSQSSVTYIVSDGTDEDQATLTVTITGENAAPVASADTGTTNENSVLSVGVGSGLLANDSDVDTNDNLVITLIDNGTTTVAPGNDIAGSNGGIFNVSANGSYTFDPNSEYSALNSGQSDTSAVTYTLSDGTTTDTAVLTVTITGVDAANSAPVAANDSGATDEATVLNVNAANGVIQNNDTDVDADTLTVTQVTNGSNQSSPGVNITGTNGGIFNILSDGSYSFDPNDEFEYLGVGVTADTSVTYTVSDGSATDQATLTVTVTGLNDPPVAVNDSRTTDENTVLNITDGNGLLIINDSDLDSSDTLTITLISNGVASVSPGNPIAGTNGGIFNVALDGSYSFDPNDEFTALSNNETDTTSITYTLSDGTATDTAVLTVTVTGVDNGGGSGFNFANMTQLVNWDAGEPSSLTLEGSNVRYWDDLSGNGYQLTNASSNRWPVLSNSQGNPVVSFFYDYLQSSGQNISGVDFTAFLVIGAVDLQVDATERFFFGTGDSGSIVAGECLRIGTTGTLGEYVLKNDQTINFTVTDPETYPMILTLSQIGDTMEVRHNSQVVADRQAFTKVSGSRDFFVGAGGNRFNFTTDGDIYQVLIISNTSAEDIQGTTEKLATDWGVTLNDGSSSGGGGGGSVIPTPEPEPSTDVSILRNPQNVGSKKLKNSIGQKV